MSKQQHDPEFDLLKRYVIEQRTPSGWLGVESFDDTDTLAEWMLYTPILFNEWDVEYRIFDQRLGRAL